MDMFSDFSSSSVPPGEYASWYQTAYGQLSLVARTNLIWELLAGWPRRSRSILVLTPGIPLYLSQLWEAGFDVTAVESSLEQHKFIASHAGFRFSYILSALDHLPCEDNSFDYVLFISNGDPWKDLVPVLEEMDRVSCNGCILLFPSAWSLFSCEVWLQKQKRRDVAYPGSFVSPFAVDKAVRQVFPEAKRAFYSTMLLPEVSILPHRLMSFSTMVLRGPFGAFAGVRIDKTPLCASGGIPLLAGKPLTSIE